SPRAPRCALLGSLSFCPPRRSPDLPLALSRPGAYCVARSAGGLPLAERLLRTALDLARQESLAHAESYGLAAHGFVAAMTGRWQLALERLDEGEKVFRQGCTSNAWEGVAVHHFRMLSLIHLGSWGEMAGRMPADLEEARRRGDRYSEILLHVHEATSLLGADQPEQALQRLRLAGELWEQPPLNVVRFHQARMACEVNLYVGEVERAWRPADDLASRTRLSPLGYSQTVRTWALGLRLRCALAVGAIGEARRC